MMFSLNHTLIRGTELFSAFTGQSVSPAAAQRRPAQAPDYIEDIPHVLPAGGTIPRPGMPLISLVPSSWASERSSKDRTSGSSTWRAGLMYEMVKALNEKGFVVDIVNCHKPGIKPRKRYDLYLGHGGHTRSILDPFAG